jgi:general secretion pathway protein G
MKRRDHQLKAVKPKQGDAGYTLTEMLVVIVIISLIAAVLTPSLLGQLSRAKAKTASLQLDSTATSLDLFKEDVGRYPTQEEGLSVLVTNQAQLEGWLGPYLKSDKALKDPWGRKLVYKINADESVTILTLGSDGKEGGKGTAEDILVTVR